MPHVIRLRAAWNRYKGSEEKRVNLPDKTTVATEGDLVSYRRSFNAPTGISETTPIAFVVDSWVGDLCLTLDQIALVQKREYLGQPLRIDFAGLLRHHHQAEITLRPSSVNPQPVCSLHVGLTGSCFLEID